MYLERLQQELDQQKEGQQLVLNDKVIDEQGCNMLSEFLRENNRFNSLEIKGCNITSVGFAKICEGLKTNLRLNSLIAEWNQIGSGNSILGLDALKNLVEENPSLQTVDLKNNGIKPEGAQLIAQIIAQNSSLVSLDLKWNEIGIKGGELIVDSLQYNGKLKYLDISCNKVPEEMIQEVNRVLARNKRGVSGLVQQKQQQQQSLNMTQQQQQAFRDTMPIQQQQQQQQNNILNSSAPNFVQTKKNKKDELDEILKIERGRVKEVKAKLEKELDEEKRIRQNLEKTYHSLKQQVLQKETIIGEQEINYQNLIQENQLYRLDVESIKRELNDLSKNSKQSLQQAQEQLQNNQKDIAILEREHIHEADNIMADHEEYVKNMLRDFQLRYNGLDDQYRQLKTQKNQQEDKTNVINENMLRYQLDHEESIRNLKGRLADEEKKKYQENLTLLEDKLAQAKELRDKTIRKNGELVKEIDYKEEKLVEQIQDKFGHGYQIEINDIREKINKLHNELSLSNLEIDFEKYHHIKVESSIDYLEEELAERHRDLIRIKEYQREQHDFTNAINNSERRVFKDNTEQLHKRICELDSALRNQNAENEKLRTDYDRICNTLQHGVGRVLTDTMATHTDIMRRKAMPPINVMEPQFIPPPEKEIVHVHHHHHAPQSPAPVVLNSNIQQQPPLPTQVQPQQQQIIRRVASRSPSMENRQSPRTIIRSPIQQQQQNMQIIQHSQPRQQSMSPQRVLIGQQVNDARFLPIIQHSQPRNPQHQQ